MRGASEGEAPRGGELGFIQIRALRGVTYKHCEPVEKEGVRAGPAHKDNAKAPPRFASDSTGDGAVALCWEEKQTKALIQRAGHVCSNVTQACIESPHEVLSQMKSWAPNSSVLCEIFIRSIRIIGLQYTLSGNTNAPGAHHPTAVIPILVGGADLMVPGVVQPVHALVGAHVSDARVTAPRRWAACPSTRTRSKITVLLTVRRSLHTWKDHLWTLGPGAGCPFVATAAAEASSEATGGAGNDSDGTERNGGGTGHKPANAPALMQDSATAAERIEKLTPEGRYRYHPRQHQALCVQVTLRLFARVRERGRLKLKDTRPDVHVDVVFPTHADVVAHQSHHTVVEEDKWRRRAKEREAQVAEATNTGKTITVTELWQPHLDTLPQFEDLRPTTPYPLADVKSALLTYAEKHDLVNCFEQQFTNTSSDAVFSAAHSNAKGTFEVQRRPTGTDSFSLSHCNKKYWSGKEYNAGKRSMWAESRSGPKIGPDTRARGYEQACMSEQCGGWILREGPQA
ncbi:hypothetical protein EDB85DRAFT_1897103 [Lactarius pseudohatsudake]|nr:hypothetical protein EDB85DRAFT_1897103 [Lactarius pseudohatsudake]